MNYLSKRSQSGVTLVETMIAAAIIAIFFATIFELNAVCLRYIDASKESVAALQGVQDRVEVLRNLSFTDLTNGNVVQNLICQNKTDRGRYDQSLRYRCKSHIGNRN